MKLLYAFADVGREWNCSQWRCLTPSDAINRSGLGSSKIRHIQDYCRFLDPDMQDICGEAEVHILERNVFAKPVWNAMDYWRGMGKTIVVQWDDAYQLLPRSNPAYPFWITNTQKLDPAPLDGMIEALNRADAFVSPNKLILEDWREHVHATYWLPNFGDNTFYRNLPKTEADFDNWLEARLARLDNQEAVKGQNEHLKSVYDSGQDRIVIGYGSSMSHYDSWMGSGLMEAAKQLCQERPDVLFRVHGNDRRFFDLLEVPDSNKQHVYGVPPDDWPSLMSLFDVGLAPLSGIYDQRRSWLKVVEYMMAQVPWLASSGVPYDDLRGWGLTVEHEPEQANVSGWLEALIETVDHIDDAKAHARGAAYAKSKTLTMDANVQATLRTYEKITKANRDQALPGVMYVKAA